MTDSSYTGGNSTRRIGMAAMKRIYSPPSLLCMRRCLRQWLLLRVSSKHAHLTRGNWRAKFLSSARRYKVFLLCTRGYKGWCIAHSSCMWAFLLHARGGYECHQRAARGYKCHQQAFFLCDRGYASMHDGSWQRWHGPWGWGGVLIVLFTCRPRDNWRLLCLMGNLLCLLGSGFQLQLCCRGLSIEPGQPIPQSLLPQGTWHDWFQSLRKWPSFWEKPSGGTRFILSGTCWAIPATTKDTAISQHFCHIPIHASHSRCASTIKKLVEPTQHQLSAVTPGTIWTTPQTAINPFHFHKPDTCNGHGSRSIQG